MPFTTKGKEIMKSMKSEYGSKKGEQVFYASRNKGKIKGVDQKFFGQHDYKATGHGLKISAQQTDTRSFRGENEKAINYGRGIDVTKI